MKSILQANISWTKDVAVTHVCALHVLSRVLSSQQSYKELALLPLL